MFDLGLGAIAAIIKNKSQNSMSQLLASLKASPSLKTTTTTTTKPVPQLTQQKPATRTTATPHTPAQHQQSQLQQRKNKLLRQLQSVEQEILKKKIATPKIEMKNKNKQQQPTPEVMNRAAELVARMNQKRREHSEAEKKKSQLMEQRMQDSLRKIKEMSDRQEKQKEEKRLEIELRINKRKEQMQYMTEFSKKTDGIVSELQSYRTSLPIIKRFRNPEELQKSLDGILKKKPKNSAQKAKAQKKSPFLERIQQEELNLKREQYIKSFEKKRIRQRQQVYGRKIRKNLKDSSLFVTQ